MINFTSFIFIVFSLLVILFYFLLKNQEIDRLLKSISISICIMITFSVFLVSNFDFVTKKTSEIGKIEIKKISEIESYLISEDYFLNHKLKKETSGSYLIEDLNGKTFLIDRSLFVNEENGSNYLDNEQSGIISFQIIEKKPIINFLKFVNINAIRFEKQIILTK